MRFKLIAALALCASSTLASAQQISSPTAGYLAATTRFDIPGAPYSSLLNSLTSGSLTLTFSIQGEKRVTPGSGGWATWSAAPESERAADGTLDVLYFGDATKVNMQLSRPVSIFGFEMEPDEFGEQTFNAFFYNGDALVGSVSRLVDGNAGARLFAFQGAIDRVEFNGTDQFAAGAFRFADATVPEPSSLVLTGAGLVALAVVRRRRRA
jgi:hypothetical protein